MNRTSTVSTRDIARRTLVVIGLALLGGLVAATLALAADVLLVFFGGILLAVFFAGLGELISRFVHISPRVAVVLVIALVLAIVGVALWLLAAELADQVSELGTGLMQVWTQLRERLETQTWGRQLLALAAGRFSGDSSAGAGASLATIFSTTLGAVANVFIVLFLGIYLAANPDWYLRGVVRIVPPARRSEARDLLSEIGHSLRWWLFGRAVGMVIVGVLTGVGLWLLDVPMALALGFMASLADFVPFVGPIAAAAPAMLIASTQGTTQLGYVALLYVGIQLFEGYVLTPLIEQRSVRLPPALTIGAQVLLGVLVGPLGVVFATPLLTVVVLLTKRLYIEEAIEHRAHRVTHARS